MGLTYEYATGRITRDFHFKKADTVCHIDQDRTVLIGVMCRTCPFYAGQKAHYSPAYDRMDLVMCKFHKEDDPGLSEIVSDMYAVFEQEAITHIYD